MNFYIKGIVAIAGVMLSVGACGQEGSDESTNTVHISGRLVAPNGSPIRDRIVTLRKLAINEPLQDSKTATDEGGGFAFSATRGNLYQVFISVTNLLSMGIGTIEVADGREVSMGDVVLEFSPQQDPIVHFSGPIRIKGLASTTDSGGKLGFAPLATSIVAIYIACSAVPKEFCSGGTVHILLGDGAEVLPPMDKDQVGGSSASISRDRQAAGWLADYDNCCSSDPISLGLMVYRPQKPLLKLHGDGRGIFNWDFVAGGKQVALFQDYAHFGSSPHCELRDVETGRLISKWDGRITQKSPKWAKKIAAGF